MRHHQESWTSAECFQAMRMDAAGMSRSQIAKQMGRTRNAVCGKLFRLSRNVDQPVTTLEPSPAAEAPSPTPLLWTDGEVERLLLLRGQGYGMFEIAEALGRSRDSVCRKADALRHLGWDVPRLPRGRRSHAMKPLPQTARPASNTPLWEMDEADRRLALWQRAKAGAAKTRRSSAA